MRKCNYIPLHINKEPDLVVYNNSTYLLKSAIAKSQDTINKYQNDPCFNMVISTYIHVIFLLHNQTYKYACNQLPQIISIICHATRCKEEQTFIGHVGKHSAIQCILDLDLKYTDKTFPKNFSILFCNMYQMFYQSILERLTNHHLQILIKHTHSTSYHILLETHKSNIHYCCELLSMTTRLYIKNWLNNYSFNQNQPLPNEKHIKHLIYVVNNKIASGCLEK